MDSRPASIAAIAERVVAGAPFAPTWREFLDSFYPAPSAAALATEPQLLVTVLNDQGYADAFLGAMAAELARRFQLPVPAWTEGQARYLREPHFALKSRSNWAILLQDSPAEFRARRLFVTKNVLDRA